MRLTLAHGVIPIRLTGRDIHLFHGVPKDAVHGVDAHPFVTQCDVLPDTNDIHTHQSSTSSAIGIEIEA